MRVARLQRGGGFANSSSNGYSKGRSRKVNSAEAPAVVPVSLNVSYLNAATLLTRGSRQVREGNGYEHLLSNSAENARNRAYESPFRAKCA